jgi:hypothetical protein
MRAEFLSRFLPERCVDRALFRRIENSNLTRFKG